MYSKTSLSEAGTTLQHLATLRPGSIIPPLVERMQEALGNITEPHKLVASMHAVMSVVRSLVYPEGPKEQAFPEVLTINHKKTAYCYHAMPQHDL